MQLGLSAAGLASGLNLAGTLDVGRTATALLGALAACSLLLLFSSLEDQDWRVVLRFAGVGVALNLALTFFQFSASDMLRLRIGSFEFAAGTFANQNHFASLVIASLPLAVFTILGRGGRVWLLLLAPVVILALASRSLAAAYLAAGTLVLSVAVLADMRRLVRGALLLSLVLGAVVLAFNPSNILELEPNSPLGRPQIWATSLQAVLAFLPFGSGLGTFTLAYGSLETTAAISSAYINHAHNDYLEFLVEAGIPGAVVLILGVALLVSTLAAWRRLERHAVAALIGIGVLGVHALVDYPLRSEALVTVAVALGVIAFGIRAWPDGSSARGRGRRFGPPRGLMSLLGARHLELPNRKPRRPLPSGSRAPRSPGPPGP
jgi:O-antigen ligase